MEKKGKRKKKGEERKKGGGRWLIVKKIQMPSSSPLTAAHGEGQRLMQEGGRRRQSEKR